jgi:hypothetical protein
MRKRSLGTIGIALVLSVTMIGTGCSTSWIMEAEQIVSALIPAAGNLITLVAALQGKTVSATDQAMIQNAGTQASADLQLIQSLIAAYESADAATKPGILNQIQNALHAVQGNLQGLLAGMHIKDAATQAKITAVVGLVLSEVQSLATIVPLVQGSGSGGQGLAMARMTAVRPTAPLSANEFVKSYNSTLSARTGSPDLDRVTTGLKIHLHGKTERWVSGGVLR